MQWWPLYLFCPRPCPGHPDSPPDISHSLLTCPLCSSLFFPCPFILHCSARESFQNPTWVEAALCPSPPPPHQCWSSCKPSSWSFRYIANFLGWFLRPFVRYKALSPPGSPLLLLLGGFCSRQSKWLTVPWSLCGPRVFCSRSWALLRDRD